MDANQITTEQIAATLAHEVKNPISLVMACIDLLEAEDIEGKGKKSYEIMRRELSKVTEIMLDFIQLTKPMERKGQCIYIDKLLISILCDCQELYKNVAKFEWIVENKEFKLIGDEIKLKRVFFNIYKNAAEAVEGPGIIKTELSLRGLFAEIRITDNGIGLTDDVKQKISLPFFTTKETGSGLGVYICKNIISEHGGFFEIDGSYGEGCVVTVKLPLVSCFDKPSQNH